MPEHTAGRVFRFAGCESGTTTGYVGMFASWKRTRETNLMKQRELMSARFEELTKALDDARRHPRRRQLRSARRLPTQTEELK